MTEDEFDPTAGGASADIPDWHDDPAPDHDGGDLLAGSQSHDAASGLHDDLHETTDFPDYPDHAETFGSAEHRFGETLFEETSEPAVAAPGQFEAAAEQGQLGTEGDELVESFTVDTRSGATGEWAYAIGAGAADPAGAHHTAFEYLDLHPTESEPDLAVDLAWVSSSVADRDNWVQPELLQEVLHPEQSIDARSVRTPEESIRSLWQRLSPGLPMPETDSGEPDLTTALDEIEARQESSPMQDVVRIARQLLSG